MNEVSTFEVGKVRDVMEDAEGNTFILFYTLSKWVGDTKMREWLTSVLPNPEMAMSFFKTVLNKSHVSGPRGARTVYTLHADQIERFTELEKLADAVAKVAHCEFDSAALEKLRVAIQSKKEDKPHKPTYVLSRDETGQFVYDQSDSTL